MRENLIQKPVRGADGRSYINGDWYPGGLPPNVDLAENIYLDTSYGFAGFHSTQPHALIMDEGSGLYETVSFMVSEKGKISIGKFSIINGVTFFCNNTITIGEHCMLGWGVTISDTWPHATAYSVAARQEIMHHTAGDPSRPYPFAGRSLPVVLEDNCWVGFDSVILPGVRLGRGCVIGCKTVVSEDVPPYAIVAGSPAKIIRYLNPDDTAELKEQLLADINH